MVIGQLITWLANGYWSINHMASQWLLANIFSCSDMINIIAGIYPIPGIFTSREKINYSHVSL